MATHLVLRALATLQGPRLHHWIHLGPPQYYNDIFLPVMSRYPPHELMAQADAQPHAAPLPHTLGPSSKGLTAVPRRVLGDVTNRTPTRLVR